MQEFWASDRWGGIIVERSIVLVFAVIPIIGDCVGYDDAGVPLRDWNR